MLARRVVEDIPHLGDPADAPAVGAFHLPVKLLCGLDLASEPKHVIDLHAALVAALTPEVDGVVSLVAEGLTDSAGHPENVK